MDFDVILDTCEYYVGGFNNVLAYHLKYTNFDKKWLIKLIFIKLLWKVILLPSFY